MINTGNNKNKIITVVGPTASGKTSVAIELAKKLDGEIISSDSRLVYTDFNIGTAKPTMEEREGIPHYLIDVADPREEFTVSLFKTKSAELIEDMFSRGKVPIIVGGTGFYIKALLEGLMLPEVKADNEFRNEMRILAEEKGRAYLHQKLMEVDPMMGSKLYVNDSFRVIRALEVIKATGKLMSEVQIKIDPGYNVIYTGLACEDREFLYDRINYRVDLMLEQGLVEEVKSLIAKYGETVSIMKTLGYKEICEYLNEDCTFEESIEKLKKNTRNYAKRQLTWFNANSKINWFLIDKMDKEKICSNIIELYKN